MSAGEQLAVVNERLAALEAALERMGGIDLTARSRGADDSFGVPNTSYIDPAGKTVTPIGGVGESRSVTLIEVENTPEALKTTLGTGDIAPSEKARMMTFYVTVAAVGGAGIALPFVLLPEAVPARGGNNNDWIASIAVLAGDAEDIGASGGTTLLVPAGEEMQYAVRAQSAGLLSYTGGLFLYETDLS